MSECREWQGTRTKSGYGQLRRGGKPIYLHRWVMAQVHGWEALEGRVVMHTCDNPPCFRYDHLRLGDTAANAQDMSSKRRGVNQWGSQPSAGLVAMVHQMRNAGANQQVIADCLGMSQSSVSNYLLGVRT